MYNHIDQLYLHIHHQPMSHTNPPDQKSGALTTNCIWVSSPVLWLLTAYEPICVHPIRSTLVRWLCCLLGHSQKQKSFGRQFSAIGISKTFLVKTFSRRHLMLLLLLSKKLTGIVRAKTLNIFYNPTQMAFTGGGCSCTFNPANSMQSDTCNRK